MIPIVGITFMAIGHDHSQVFRTWSYETEEPLSLEALRETARKLPASVYRCKGVVHTAEEPGRRVILQVVGKRVDIAVGDAWNGREPRTRIIAIGAHDGVDGAALREVFDRCRDVEGPRIASTDLDVNIANQSNRRICSACSAREAITPRRDRGIRQTVRVNSRAHSISSITCT